MVLAALAASNLVVAPAFAQSTATYAYDALGRLVRVTYPGGAYSAYAYDDAGNRIVLAMSLTPNNPPVANPDGPVIVPIAGSANIDVLANDTDSDNDAKAVHKVTQGSKGAVAIISSGAMVSYTATPGQTGADSFTYIARDARLGISAPATVTVMIGQAPNAVDDDRSTPQNTPLTFNPLLNDTNPNNGTLTVTGVSSATGGSASYTATSVTFTPNPGFTGSGSFNYTMTDGLGGSDTATVTVSVTASAPVNSPPDAVDDNRTTPFQTVLNFNPLGNDTDPNSGDTLTIVGVGAPTSGGSTSYVSNLVSYAPPNGFSGQASFTYTISDGHDGTDTATVYVTVSPPTNQPPVANADSASTPQADMVTINPLTNDSDPENQGLTLWAHTQPTNSSLGSVGRNGSQLFFTPAAGSAGQTAYFTYTVKDGFGLTSVGNVSVAITNTPPYQGTYPLNLPYNAGAQTFDPRLSPTDADGQAVSVISVTQPSQGLAEHLSATSVRFTPATGQSGNFSFTYTVQDTAGAQQTGTVTIAISPPSVFSVSQDKTYWNGGRTFGTPWNSTGPVQVTASGGSGSYRLEWERVDGDQNTVVSPSSVASGTSITSNWNRPTGNTNTYTSTWRCKVTDLGTNAVGYSQNITVVFEIEN